MQSPSSARSVGTTTAPGSVTRPAIPTINFYSSSPRLSPNTAAAGRNGSCFAPLSPPPSSTRLGANAQQPPSDTAAASKVEGATAVQASGEGSCGMASPSVGGVSVEAGAAQPTAEQQQQIADQQQDKLRSKVVRQLFSTAGDGAAAMQGSHAAPVHARMRMAPRPIAPQLALLDEDAALEPGPLGPRPQFAGAGRGRGTGTSTKAASAGGRHKGGAAVCDRLMQQRRSSKGQGATACSGTIGSGSMASSGSQLVHGGIGLGCMGGMRPSGGGSPSRKRPREIGLMAKKPRSPRMPGAGRRKALRNSSGSGGSTSPWGKAQKPPGSCPYGAAADGLPGGTADGADAASGSDVSDDDHREQGGAAVFRSLGTGRAVSGNLGTFSLLGSFYGPGAAAR